MALDREWERRAVIFSVYSNGCDPVRARILIENAVLGVPMRDQP
jgi:hypothetical protein